MSQHQVPMVRLEFGFKGSTLGYVAHALGAALLSVVTLGLAVPWAQAMMYRWVSENTVVNGQRLRFTGSGGKLFGQYIKWWLLTVVTLGLYGFVVANRMRAWAISHQEGLAPAALPGGSAQVPIQGRPQSVPGVRQG